MKILNLIEKRNSSGFGKDVKDVWFESLSMSDEKEIAVILTENELTRYRGVNKDSIITIREKNRLKGMFELGAVLPTAGVKLVLYIFTKERPSTFYTGVYSGNIMKKRVRSVENIEWESIYTEQFYEYLDKIENWLSSGQMELDSDYYSFHEVDNELFENDVYIPRRYTKNVFRVDEALKQETTVCLSEVANVLRPRPDDDKSNTAKHLTVSEWRYPLSYSNLRDGILTDTPIMRNDILFMNFDNIYLVDEELKDELHLSPNFYIIRPKNISAHYLFMYLQSETAKIILQSLAMGSVLSRVRMVDMLNLPVIMPTLSSIEYYQTFKLKYYKPTDIAEYSRTNRLLAYATKLKASTEKKKESVENILGEEWAQSIHVCKTEVMQEFLESDINELNTCFRGKAYKATLILAGSILEAVLIDWLTEIKGVNYFDEPYILRKEQWDKRNNCVKRDRNGNIMYYNKEAGLADYIDEIKELARPAWMKADEAHKIRKKRNLVHAKLCMSDTTEINEQTCREVIQYLKDVIETRGLVK